VSADLHSVIRVRVGSVVRDDQEAVVSFADCPDVRCVVVPIAKHEACGIWEPSQEGECEVIVRSVGRGELGGQRDPDAGDDTDEVQLPAVDPSMPATLGPIGFGIDAGMWDQASRTVLDVPGATTCVEHRRVDRHRTAAVGPGCECSTRQCPKHLICAGKVSGIRPRRRSQVRRQGTQPCSLSRARISSISGVASAKTANNSPGRWRWRTIMTTSAFRNSDPSSSAAARARAASVQSALDAGGGEAQ
jgi:hypothetical protein